MSTSFLLPMMSFNFLDRTCGITTFARVATKVGLASMSTINKSVPPTSSYDGIVCDMDGVLWRGQEEIPRSIDALNVLKLRGKSVVFVTNNSAKTRLAISKRLHALGYDAKPSDIITSSSVTANYLTNILGAKDVASDRDNVKKSQIKVFMIGNPALREELEASDFQVLSVPDTESANLDEDELVQLQKSLDTDIRAVVVGVDTSFTFRKLSISGLYLLNKRCLFVATNPDNGNRISSGGMHPETGSLIAAVQSLSGIKPTICGKPSRITVEHVMKQIQNSNPNRLLMVGDRLDTDIAFANAAHFPSCLVLSGVTSEGEAEGISNSLDTSQIPTFLARDLWDMVSPVSEEDLKALDVLKSGKKIIP